MSSLYTDGFFYHPDGTSPSAVIKRIDDGATNPRLDDIFALAIQETKDALHENDKRKDRLFARLDQIEAELARLVAEEQEINARLISQHEVIAKYQRGDDLDESERELVTPKCASLVHEQQSEDLDSEFARHADSIPEGWKITNKRMDDEFIYVTIKRERSTRKSAEATVVKKIRNALDLFFMPEFKRDDRVRYTDRLGSLSPAMPGAG